MAITDVIRRSVALGEKLGHIFVTTADPDGMPHLAAAGKIRHVAGNQVEVSAWFCPGTLNNLQGNRNISLVVWDAAADSGHQLLGMVQRIGEDRVMNGFAPEIDTAQPLPQLERILTVRIDKVIAFSHAPHSDIEE